MGLIALRPEWFPFLEKYITRERVRQHFRGVITGDVERYELPNLKALNCLLHGALDGGGTLSLKTDAQGKVFSTALLRGCSTCPDAGAKRYGRPAAPVGGSRRPSSTRGGWAPLWGYGARRRQWLRWVGIGFLAAAAILRFIGPRCLKGRSSTHHRAALARNARGGQR